MNPIRIQLSRKRGWRMPPNTVKVCRPCKWGNPWKVGGEYVVARERGKDVTVKFTAAECVDRFRQYCRTVPLGRLLAFESIHELRGKNLACWCKLDAPCHADVLLEIANDPVPY